MRVSVFGLGYVGTVTAACLVSEGHEVVGVDSNATKVELVNQGRSPVIEAGIAELVGSGLESGRLQATTDSVLAVAHTDIALVCVGTPSNANGSLSLQFLEQVSIGIGEALRTLNRFFVVVIRSTVLPGTVRNVVIPLLEKASGLVAGEDFGVCMYPEFLREGSAVNDYYHPPKVVIGSLNEKSLAPLRALALREGVPAFDTDLEMSEMVKYADNAWHATKIAFANEIGTISKAHDVDGRQLMEIFCSDRKLNISPSYLRPGFAFGGSCLPKDVRALVYQGRRVDLDLPLLGAVLASNERHLDRAFELVLNQPSRKVGILGLSFKAGTDDLRESPAVTLVERLIGKGYDVRIFDSNVSLSALVGANREYIAAQLPHVGELMVSSIDEVLEHADIIVAGNNDAAFRDVAKQLGDGQVFIDLVDLSDRRTSEEGYEGICW